MHTRMYKCTYTYVIIHMIFLPAPEPAPAFPVAPVNKKEANLRLYSLTSYMRT